MMDCPICGKEYQSSEIENHVNKCLFLNDISNDTTPRTTNSSCLLDESSPISNKRPHTASIPLLSQSKKINDEKKSNEPLAKKGKYIIRSSNKEGEDEDKNESSLSSVSRTLNSEEIFKRGEATSVLRNDVKLGKKDDHVPLAEKVRPTALETYFGQEHVLGPKTVLLQLLEKREIPSMILWGPPGCGKTSLASVISQICKKSPAGKLKYVKLSAAMSGVNDVKDAVARAANDLKFGRRTVMFMDEIHRFNKLQQDIFLPHVEAGTVTLVGATTENPCFSLNSALLSRCRVVVLEKLKTSDLVSVLKNAVKFTKGRVHAISEIVKTEEKKKAAKEKEEEEEEESFLPIFIIDEETIQWLAETCDGDARIALGGLELAIQSKAPSENEFLRKGPGLITLDDVKESLKKSHVIYDKKGDQHYNLISALHKSVRASDDNAAIYWLARMIAGGEDPLYIARRLVRMASEDVGLADPKALGIAVSVMNGCKMIGMPECDVLLAQCTIYLARAPKSRMMEDALRAAQRLIAEQKGHQPDVPMHLRSTGSSKLVSLLGNGKGYNMLNKDESGLNYMPEGLEDINFFEDDHEFDDITD